MFKNVYLKNLRDMKNNLIYWAIGITILGFYISYAYSSFAEDIDTWNELLANFPEELMYFFGGSEGMDMSTFAGFLNLEIFGLMGPIMLIIVGINSGTHIVAGELNNKTLEMVMSTSIGKNKYLFQQILVMVTRIVIISIILWSNFFIFANLFNLELDLKNLTAIVFHLTLLSLSIASFALLIGSITGNKSTTLGLSAGIAVLSYFINSISPMIKGIENLKYISVFYYYKHSEPLINGVNLESVSVMLFISLLFIILSFVAFKYKDLY